MRVRQKEKKVTEQKRERRNTVQRHIDCNKVGQWRLMVAPLLIKHWLVSRCRKYKDVKQQAAQPSSYVEHLTARDKSGSNGVFGRGCVLLGRLAVWWRGEGLLLRRRERTHGRRWKAVVHRGPHGGSVVRKRRSTKREARREHHPWGWRGPHWRWKERVGLTQMSYKDNMIYSKELWG